MKKILSLCVILLLAAAMLAGCTSEKAPEKKVQTVKSVDELIAAIAPGAEIQIAEGNFVLSSASTYGQRTGNPYVRWDDSYGGGSCLSIHDVDGLTIRGSGAEATILLSQYADVDVLAFQDCTNITLSDFTGGHTPQSNGCSAGVVRLYRSDDVTMTKVGLFGCGTEGVTAQKINNLTISESEIYDCSIVGMYLTECFGVKLENCNFHGIGMKSDWYSGDTIVSAAQCYDVTMTGCSVENNNLRQLISAYDTRAIRMKNNQFRKNTVQDGMFLLSGSETVVETNNVFEDNIFSHWYWQGWEGADVRYAVNENGERMFPEDPQPTYSACHGDIPTPVRPEGMTQVTVKTVDELLANIGDDAEIILTEKLYDLTTASDYGKTSPNAKHYYWEETFDGPQLVICGVKNFSITTDNGVPEDHTITAGPRYANVLTFRDCINVQIYGLTAGHTVEPGYCSGGVLSFEDGCDTVLVDNCNLYGCGVMGVYAQNMTGLQVFWSYIYECSNGGIQAFDCQDISIVGCTFRDLGGETYQFSYCTNVNIDGSIYNGEYFGS